MALCVTEVKCLVNRSLGSSRRPRYRTCEFHGITVCWQRRGAGGTGRGRVKKNGPFLVNIDLKFPSGKITKQYGHCTGEPVNYGVSSPRLSKNGGVIDI
jgi:hypothetical protein